MHHWLRGMDIAERSWYFVMEVEETIYLNHRKISCPGVRGK